MAEKELWKYFWDKKVCMSKPFDRDFIWLLKEDFQPVQNNFIKEFNVLHPGNSFRSKGYLAHIHVVVQGDYIFVHKDMGNVARFFPLGLIHFVFDVLPYFIFAGIKKVPMRSIFVRPE
jgi:hypothetical protein